jgi:hypothetical protein
MSGIFSIAAHCVLQYLPDVVVQEHTGCAHFSPLEVVIFDAPSFRSTVYGR